MENFISYFDSIIKLVIAILLMFVFRSYYSLKDHLKNENLKLRILAYQLYLGKDKIDLSDDEKQNLGDYFTEKEIEYIVKNFKGKSIYELD